MPKTEGTKKVSERKRAIENFITTLYLILFIVTLVGVPYYSYLSSKSGNEEDSISTVMDAPNVDVSSGIEVSGEGILESDINNDN